jgi:uncharacterized protein
MKLGARLAMLPRAPEPVGAEPRVGAAEPAEATARPGAGPEGHAETLATLRAKMAEILGRPAPPPRPPADPAETDLPFVRTAGPHGVLCQRREALRPSHHVGRIPVEAARDAAPELLALLALEPALAEIDPRAVLFLDTETTGLGGGAGTLAFLVGLAGFDAEGRLVIEQLFLRSPGEEAPLLGRVAERIAAASALVTFNGKSFDMPLLEGRYVMNRMPRPPARPHLDLVHVARRLHRSRLGACTLKAVEAGVLGFVRDQDIDGGDVAPRYAHFLRTGDALALQAVVDHNFWDVVSLAALVGLYGEPLGLLAGEDLVGLAVTLQRARALDRAAEVAEAAVLRGGGMRAVHARGRIAKARGDRERALADFECLAAGVDDPGARLELAKLYEHHVKDPRRALELCERGTGETEAALTRRRERLARKIARDALAAFRTAGPPRRKRAPE